MKITAGEKIRRYAEVFGLELDEVVDWVNGYVNEPKEYGFPVFESTEQERIKSIGKYMDLRLENSSWGKIKSMPKQERKAA